jgi:TPR repeat protein
MLKTVLEKCYKVGRGVDQDYAKALYWLSKAANQGIDESYYQLGMMYELGQGVTKNEDNALLLYEKASQIYDEKSIKSRMNENEKLFMCKKNFYSKIKRTFCF